MKFLVFFFFIGLAILSAHGQKRQVSKIISEIESNNLVEAKSKIDLFEKEEGKSAELYFVKYLYFKSGEASIDFLDSANVNFLNAFQALSAYELKEREKVCKAFRFCEEARDSLFRKLENATFKVYSSSLKINQIQNFIKKYPSSSLINQSRNLIDSLEYEDIKNSDDSQLFEKYISTHSNLKFNALAQDKIYEFAYAKVLSEDLLLGYETFVKQFPNAPQSVEARTKIVEKKWEEILRNPSVTELENFIKNYPNTSYEKRANVKLEEIMWSDALKFDTPALYKAYFQRFPNGSNVEVAKKQYELKRDNVLPFLTNEKKYKLFDIESQAFVSEESYDFVSLLSGGKFIVARNKKFGVIDRSGKVILPITYTEIYYMVDYLGVKLGDKMALYALTGEKKLDFLYDDISRSGDFILTKKNGDTEDGDHEFDIYNLNLSKVFSGNYKWIESVQENLFLANQNGKYSISNGSGIKISASYDFLMSNEDNTQFVVELNDKKGVISADGKVVVPLVYKYLSSSNDTKFYIATNELKQDGVLSRDGKILLPFQNQDISYLGNSIFSISPKMAEDEVFVLIKLYDLKTKSYLKCENLTSVGAFEQGYAHANSRERKGIIDTTGRWIVPAIYDDNMMYEGEGFYEEDYDAYEEEISDFYEQFEFNNRYYDDSSNTYNSEVFNDGLAVVELDGLFGYVNFSGEITIPIIYTYAENFYKGIAEVITSEEENNLHQIIDTKGKVIVENASIDTYFQKDSKVLIEKDDCYYVLDLLSWKLTQLTTKKGYQSVYYTNDFYVCNYKDVNVIVLPTGQELMGKSIDFSDYEFKAKLREVYTLYSNGSYDEAILEYKGLLQNHPVNFKILYQLYLCYEEKGDSYNSKYYLNKAIEIDPESDDLKRIRIKMNFDSKNWSEVIRDANDVLMNVTEPSSYDSEVYFKRAFAYAEQTNYALALADYTMVIKVSKNYHAAYNNRGVIYMAQKNYSMALNEYNTAIKIAESSKAEDVGLYYSNKGSALYNLKRASEACVFWRKAVALGYSQANSSILRFCK